MKIIRHSFENYLVMIKNSIGTNMFRNFYADFDGVRKDTMNDGTTSGAYYVSGILTMFGVIKKPSSTVESVVKNIEEAGWQKVESPEPGDVLVWDKVLIDDYMHDQVGFYIGEEKAISISSKTKTPFLHDWLFRDHNERGVTSIYRGKNLMPDDVKNVE